MLNLVLCIIIIIHLFQKKISKSSFERQFQLNQTNETYYLECKKPNYIIYNGDDFWNCCNGKHNSNTYCSSARDCCSNSLNSNCGSSYTYYSDSNFCQNGCKYDKYDWCRDILRQLLELLLVLFHSL